MNEEIPENEGFGTRLMRAVKILLIAGVIPGVFLGIEWISDRYFVTTGVRAPDRGNVVRLVRAVTAYEMEYSQFPLPKAVAGQDSWTTETDEAFMKVILGLDDSPDGLNPRGKVFFTEKEAREGRDGLLIVDGATSPRLVDSWGRPFVVVIDANYDHKVQGPAGEMIGQDVIAYSLGESGKFGEKSPKSW